MGQTIFQCIQFLGRELARGEVGDCIIGLERNGGVADQHLEPFSCRVMMRDTTLLMLAVRALCRV